MSLCTTSETVILPDLETMCKVFPSGISRFDPVTSPASDKWLRAPGTLTTDKARLDQDGLNIGLLASMCWAYAKDMECLRVCADYCNFLNHLDDLTDDMELKDADAIREAVMGVIRQPELWEKKIERREASAISILAYE